MATVMPETLAKVRHNVPWDLYLDLRELPENSRLRLSYHDGTLILVAPEFIHDRGAERLGLIVRAVVDAFQIEIAGTRTTTFRLQGRTPTEGDAKEPDQAFYIGASESLIRDKDAIDLEVDPPPDLAIEVDNKSDSALALPIYANLRVAEVWRYQAREQILWFGGLDAGGYRSLDRSLCLPMLTPELVLFALGQAEGIGEMAWNRWLRGWAATLPGARP